MEVLIFFAINLVKLYKFESQQKLHGLYFGMGGELLDLFLDSPLASSHMKKKYNIVHQLLGMFVASLNGSA